MINWNKLEDFAETGLPLIAYLLKESDTYKDLVEEYMAYSPSQAKYTYKELCEALEKESDTLRYRQLRKMCGKIGAMVLDCALSCIFYPHLEAQLIDSCEGGCSFSIAGPLEMNSSYNDLWEQYQKVSELLPVRNPLETVFFRKTFYVDQRILNHLAGIDEIEQDLTRFAVIKAPDENKQPLYIDTELLPKLETLLKSKHPIQLVGDAGRGKKLLLHHALEKIGRFGIFVDGRILTNEEGISSLLWKLRREALLINGVICVYGISEEWIRKYGYSLLPIIRQSFRGLSFCFCTDKGINLADGLAGDWNRMELPEIRQDSCIQVWKGYCEKFDLDLDYKRMGSKYHLSPAQVAKVARRISEAELPTSQVLIQACIDVLPAAGKNLKQMHVTYTFDDLKVTPQTKEVLENICAHVNQRERVYGQWDLESRYSYGKSVSALFCGPPGTGKTMAAHVLSSSLSLPLYSINLSQIVDKYIGETEKKLEEVFTIGERSNTILFFDEADSLFGKRSEVNDSKDRYANIEVSYILQRLEQYDGIVIMATNNRNNIDEAFSRRIRYITEFQMPDEQIRMEIWKSCFSKQTPLLDIDFEFIAKEFEFSGGDIKNIALNAAFLAAQEESEGIGMIHVLRSIQMECQKTNRVQMSSKFGKYAYLLFE